MSRRGISFLVVLVVCFVMVPPTFGAERQESVKEPNRAEAASEKTEKKIIITEKLAQRVSVDIDGDDLSDFIERLSDETGVNMAIDYGAFEDDAEIRLRKTKLKDAPLKTALKAVLRTVGLDYKAYEHFVFISTPDRLRRYPLEELETRFYQPGSSASDSLPKVVLINPAGAAQGGFGSITDLMVPVDPRAVGEAPSSGRAR